MIIYHIKRIELEANLPVRKIRLDNGTEFKNAILNEFCTEKGISDNTQLQELHNKMELLKERTGL